MKLYIFVHSFLSPAQKAVQAVHVTAELLLKYHDGSRPTVQEWARKHKTVVLVEGGNSASMNELAYCSAESKLFPTARFYEDLATLDGILTAVAVLHPGFDIEQLQDSLYLGNDHEVLINERCLNAALVRS